MQFFNFEDREDDTNVNDKYADYTPLGLDLPTEKRELRKFSSNAQCCPALCTGNTPLIHSVLL